MWCKPGQYSDNKNCVCKNKLVGRLTEECTSVINETMINNKDSIIIILDVMFLLVYFQYFYLLELFVFCVLAYFKWFKGKKLFKKYIDY